MPLTLVNKSLITSKEAVGVSTGFMATSSQSAMVTHGAAYCIIILLHDDAAGGALAHIPPSTDEAAALAKMVAFLTQRGAQAGTIQVLLGGAASRETDPNWRASFINKLQQAGLQQANVLDARVSVGGKTVIGTAAAEVRNIVYEPSTRQAAAIQITEAFPATGKASGVKVYALAAPSGAVSASGSDGQCIIV